MVESMPLRLLSVNQPIPDFMREYFPDLQEIPWEPEPPVDSARPMKAAVSCQPCVATTRLTSWTRF
jgi:hypothetical protein